MNINYIKDIEQQNDSLRKQLEGVIIRSDEAELKLSQQDFLPTFVVNYHPASYSKSDSLLFIHHNLTTTYTAIEDLIYESIMTDVECHPKRRHLKFIANIQLQCWFLGEKESQYHIMPYYWGKRKYNFTVERGMVRGINLIWDTAGEEYYMKLVPKDENEIQKVLLERLRDCSPVDDHLGDRPDPPPEKA